MVRASFTQTQRGAAHIRGEQNVIYKTFSGKHFYYDKINKDDIVITISRFPFQISVALPVIFLTLQCRPTCGALQPAGAAGICFEALMHDATEAYCQDIPAPLNAFFLTINGWKKK